MVADFSCFFFSCYLIVSRGNTVRRIFDLGSSMQLLGVVAGHARISRSPHGVSSSSLSTAQQRLADSDGRHVDFEDLGIVSSVLKTPFATQRPVSSFPQTYQLYAGSTNAYHGLMVKVSIGGFPLSFDNTKFLADYFTTRLLDTLNAMLPSSRLIKEGNTVLSSHQHLHLMQLQLKYGQR